MSKQQSMSYAAVELAAVRYAIIPEAKLLELCQAAGVTAQATAPGSGGAIDAIGAAGQSLAQRIRQRRRAAGLTQAVLASRAGIRTETLNRIERDKTEPDFRTIRKLVVALKAAEAEQV